jgi:E3 ubiquitin-protein ligase RNF139
MFEVVEPILIALPSQQNSSLKKHLYALGFCLSLLGLSIYLAVSVYGLKERIPFITPNIITIAQILAALALYILYRYEAQQTELWEELDDYVYYVNGACRLFEFVVISAVLCYRVCDFSLEWTLFQAIMALLHIYFNIWTPAKEGWQSLKLRHQVKQKLNSLPMATQEEIEVLQDVCAICLDDLKAAKVTPCKHYFHSLCLRKWLNIQSKCPMCHTSIIPL